MLRFLTRRPSFRPWPRKLVTHPSCEGSVFLLVAAAAQAGRQQHQYYPIGLLIWILVLIVTWYCCWILGTWTNSLGLLVFFSATAREPYLQTHHSYLVPVSPMYQVDGKLTRYHIPCTNIPDFFTYGSRTCLSWLNVEFIIFLFMTP